MTDPRTPDQNEQGAFTLIAELVLIDPADGRPHPAKGLVRIGHLADDLYRLALKAMRDGRPPIPGEDERP